MNSVRSFFVMLAGITLVGILAILTASISVVFVGLLSVSLVARALTVRLQPKPVPVRAKQKTRSDNIRVWNDGRGTIIDM